MTLRAIIAHYRQKGLARHQREIDWFAGQPNIIEATRNAALCKDDRGKRYSHQSRLKKAVLSEATMRLLRIHEALSRCASFSDLHDLVAGTVGDIKGIAELYIYDVSLRIGAYLHITTKYVYLHAGTRKGAQYFVKDARRKYLHMYELPLELRALKPEHVEDILCIYKDRFPEVSNQVMEPTMAPGRRTRLGCG